MGGSSGVSKLGYVPRGREPLAVARNLVQPPPAQAVALPTAGAEQAAISGGLLVLEADSSSHGAGVPCCCGLCWPCGAVYRCAPLGDHSLGCRERGKTLLLVGFSRSYSVQKLKTANCSPNDATERPQQCGDPYSPASRSDCCVCCARLLLVSAGPRCACGAQLHLGIS